MKKLPIVALLCVISSPLSAQNLRVVNAASLSSGSIAPGSIFTIFGANLASDVAFATDVQNPPQTLGGTTVTIGSAAAALFYVSPTQINGVVNPATPIGAQTVTISSSSSARQTATVTIDTNAPPGLFSLFGTGTRDGAILNAITFLLGDFSTHTANSPTYLALFATGISPAATPTVTIGGMPVQVVFSGAAPCCAGLDQINVMLPDALAGAGRVPVVVTVNGQASNTVQVVLLPPPNAQPFVSDQENQTRSRELSSLAAVPGTSLVLSADENDDVVRVVDVSSKQVTHVIVLPSGAGPVGIAVNAAGTLAVVAESGRGKAAVIDLTKLAVTTEITVDNGPVSVAIAGSQAVLVSQDAGRVSIIDLTSGAVQADLALGHGPEGIAVDAAAHRAYVTNEDDGTISVIDLAAKSVTATISLGANVRPEAIALMPGTGMAFVTAPAAGADGEGLLVNLVSGMVVSTFSTNPNHSGGSTDVAFFNSKVYFANQAGGSISILPVTAAGAAAGAAAGPIASVKVDLGARALAIDAKDNLLVVSNEGSGTLVLVSLSSNTVVGRINAVQTNQGGDDNGDDHSDRNGGAAGPAITTLAPATGKAGATVTLSISGTNLTGATAIVFVSGHGNDGGGGEGDGNGNGNGDGNGNGHDDGGASHDFTVSNIQVNAAGTQLTATVAISASAGAGPRFVRVVTSNGESSGDQSAANTFTVLP